jgi:hypothetical protein
MDWTSANRAIRGLARRLASRMCLTRESAGLPLIAVLAGTTTVLTCITLCVAVSAYGQMPPPVFTPMSPGQKVRYNLVHAVQPTDLLQTALGSGLARWRNAPYEWDQGWGAYGRRYSSRFAQHLVKRTFILAIQALDGEDPRRIRSEHTGLWPRTMDAVKFTFVAQRDDGTRGFAYSRIAGSYAGGLISRTWHPSRLHTIPAGVGAGSISVGVETGMSILNEFMPDILRKLRLR